MAQPHDQHREAGARLRRYLPPELAEDLADLANLPQPRALELLVHLTAARYTISTYLPRRVARAVLAERLSAPWLRRVEGSLLFADLSGSTALAEQLSLLGREGIERMTEALNAIFARMIDVVEQYGGELLTFGGDALLVLFDGPHHAATAGGAALALQQALDGYEHPVPGAGALPMHLHVGVESGRVTLLCAGLPHALHYAAVGRAVSGVAAAEAAAEPGQVVVGPAAAALLGPTARGEPLGGGQLRLSALALGRAPSRPIDDTPPAALDAPEEAIAALLDDLDWISPYLPPPLLRRIVAAPERPQIEADLRPVTALFAQVVGIEALADVRAPGAAARAAQVYVAAVQTAIERYGGLINKFDAAEEGVKLLAIFGAPAAYEDHAERAARAALEMQSRLADVNRDLGAEGVGLRQRVGINTGVVFAGNVGSPSRKEYTVMGDAVNVAARVLAATPWGEVWCSAGVARVVEARLACQPVGTLVVRGKSEPLAAYRVAGEREVAWESALPAAPLLGRQGDMGRLRGRLREALAGHGGALRLVGEAGVGKSRLAGALVEEALAAGARVLSVACLAYTASMPYAAWGEVLKALCGIRPAEPAAARARKIGAALAALGPEMEEWLPLLGDLARLDVPDNRLTRGLDPHMRQERRFELLERLLLAAAAERPVVLLLDDLHWADPISLDLWRRVAAGAAGHALLLVGVHRPAPGLTADFDGVDVHELRELSADACDALVDAIAGHARLGAELRRQIIARAAGNPLFLAELLRAVLASADDQPQHGARAGDAIEGLPDSLQGLLLARIDRLDESSRGVLRVASVIGQRIPFGVLHAIHPADQVALLRQLVQLDDAQITVLERQEPERVHAFRHALLQEVAYQSMLYARRRELHGRIGEYLERHHAHDLDDYYGLLAHHYRLSDRRDKAVEYLLKAGHAASAVYANAEALQSYGWALEALAGDEADARSWEAREAIAEVCANLGRYDEALAQQATVLATPGLPPEVAQRLHRQRGFVLEKQGAYAEALAELERAMALAESAPAAVSPLAAPTICADLALVRRRRGEYDLALAACERGLAAAPRDPRDRQDELVEARLHSESGVIYAMRGDYRRAEHHFGRSLAARSAIDDLPGMIASHNNLGYLWQLQSAHDRALSHYRVAEELARTIDLRYALAHALGNSADVLLCLGDYAEAEGRCREALAVARALGAQQTAAQVLITEGLICYRRGEYDLALAAFDEALQANRSLGSAHQEANALVHLAQAHSARGDHALAEQAASDALAIAEALQAQPLKAEALVSLAEAALGAGGHAAALERADAAARLSRAIGSDDTTAIALRLGGQAAAAQGVLRADDFAESARLLEAARDRFELARTWAACGAALAATGRADEGAAYRNRARATFMAVGAAGELRRTPEPDDARS